MSLGTKPLFAQEEKPSEIKPDSLEEKTASTPSPTGAMLRSLVFPGWGQWYNSKKIKAGLVFLTESAIIGTAFYWNNKAKQAKNEQNRLFYIDNRNLSFWYLGAAILLSMADAYVDSHLAGFDVSPELSMNRQNRSVRIILRHHF